MADISGLIMTVLGLSFSLASTLYTYAQDIKGARGDIKALSNELFALIGVLQHMKMQQESEVVETPAEHPLSGEPNKAVVREVLQESIEFIQELYQKLAAPKSRFQGRVQKMKWPFQSEETKQHLQRLERVKTYFMLALMSDEIDMTRQIASQISDLRSLVMESSQERRRADFRDKYRKVMEWLSPVDPQQSYEKIIRTRAQGSGAWFTDSKRFTNWRHSNTASVFWLNGITGAGKTTLMTTTVENLARLNDGRTRVAYFYCSFADSESLDVVNILGSILAQLCEPDDETCERLVSLFDDRSGNRTGKSIRLTVSHLVNLIIDQVQYLERVYILVDAVNECGDCHEVLKSLETIAISSSMKSSLHLFISSINEKGIESSFHKMPNITTETLNPRDIWNDIHLYVEDSLETNLRLRQHDPELKAKIRLALTGGAQGMFRYVYCQLVLLSRLRTPGAVAEALKSLPPTLDQTYERLLARIEGEEDRRLAREILEMLAFSFRPLKLREVCEMLQITPGLAILDESKRLTDPGDVLGICGAFLNYQKDTDVVALAHHSVKTYLVSNLPEGSKYFQLSEAEAHRNLATKCLAYLSLDVFSSGPCNLADKLGHRLQRHPLFQYAGQYWALHTQELEAHGKRELGEDLWKLLKPFLFSADHGRGNFLAWVQLLIPTSKNISGTGPLYYAASFGLTTVVRYLLKGGADIEARGGRASASPLNIASFRGHAAVVELLLEYGADPYSVDEEVGWNAIEWAHAKNHWDVVLSLEKWNSTSEHYGPERAGNAKENLTMLPDKGNTSS